MACTANTSLLPTREEVRKILREEQEGPPLTILAPGGLMFVCTLFWNQAIAVTACTGIVIIQIIRGAWEDVLPEILDETITLRQEDIFKSRMRSRFTCFHKRIKDFNLTQRELLALTEKLNTTHNNIENIICETLLKRTAENDPSSRKLEELEKRVALEFETLVRHTPLLR